MPEHSPSSRWWRKRARPLWSLIVLRKNGGYVHTDIIPKPNPDLLARMLAHANGRDADE